MVVVTLPESARQEADFKSGKQESRKPRDAIPLPAFLLSRFPPFPIGSVMRVASRVPPGQEFDGAISVESVSAGSLRSGHGSAAITDGHGARVPRGRR
ncbi:MAG: hypothetical protein WCP53_10375, partial [Verrucomicrobiota bacterium]